MTEENTIRLNPNKSSQLEFDVMISGLENILPVVRFVIVDVADQVDWVVKCKKLDGSKWQASFPAFENMKLNTCKFQVEVIVDEYYFQPAAGEIIFINTPDVSFKPKAGPKPTVTTSFVVKQDEEPVEEKPKTKAAPKPKATPKTKATPKKKVTEASAGDITGQYAPTNDLLKTEEDPSFAQGNVKTAQAELDDEYIDTARLDGITDEVIPGSGHEYAQDDGKDDDVEDDLVTSEYDPKKVAEGILKDAFGKVKAPTLRGSLFKRDADGKILVPGLENKKQKQESDDRNQKVRDILGK